MPTVMKDADAVVIRRATAADAGQLIRVAARDSQRPIHGPALIAEVGGVGCAALQLADGRVIADPFVPTADLVAMLRLLAVTADRGPARRAGKPRPIRRRLGVDDPTSSFERPARSRGFRRPRHIHEGTVRRRRRFVLRGLG